MATSGADLKPTVIAIWDNYLDCNPTTELKLGPQGPQTGLLKRHARQSTFLHGEGRDHVESLAPCLTGI